jgi:hypothetical protein
MNERKRSSLWVVISNSHAPLGNAATRSRIKYHGRSEPAADRGTRQPAEEVLRARLAEVEQLEYDVQLSGELARCLIVLVAHTEEPFPEGFVPINPR